MQESQRSQPGNPSSVSDFMDDWVRICDTCGDVGDGSLLVSCNKCTDGAAHTYCMRVKLFEKPKHWTCEECAPRPGTDKLMQDEVKAGAGRKKRHLSTCSTNHESSKGAKCNYGSSYPRKGRTIGVNSTSHLSGKRHGAPLEAQTAQKARAIETIAVSSRSSEPWKNSLFSEDLSGEESERVKTKSINDIVYSFPPRSDNSQEKEKVPNASGARKRIRTLAQIEERRRALGTSIISHKASNSRNHSPLGRETILGAASTPTSRKPSSYGSYIKEKLIYGLGDGSPNLDSQTDIAQNKCSLSAGSLLKSNSSKAASLKPKGQLAKAGCLQTQKVERNPALHDDRKRKDPSTVSKFMASDCAFLRKSNATGSKVLLADSAVTAEKNEKVPISGGETLFSGSRFWNPDAVGSSGQSYHRSQPTIHNTHKNSNLINEKKKNVSRQAEHPAKAAASAMSMFKLCTSPASNERSHLRNLAQVEAATLLQGLVVPNTHHSWLGKFLIHKSEGIARTFDGFQAHLSSCASLKVLEVVDRLPGIIILEELPRLRIWPSQFMGGQVTEENIALYFFAKDVDSYDTYYRGLMKYMINNDLALKGNLDGVELLIFPSNILPERSQRWNQMLFLWGVFKAQKVNNSANTSVSNSLKNGNGDTVKRGAIDLNAYPGDTGVDETSHSDARPGFGVAGVNLAVQGRSTTPESGSVRIEHHVKELPTSLSPAPPSTEENMDPLDWQLAETLVLLSRDRF